MDANKIFSEMAQRACEFAEMCRRMQNIPDMPLAAEVKDALDEYEKRLGLQKVDPEAWREENRKKQAAGVKFECQNHGTMWTKGNWTFTGPKEIYREEVQQEPEVNADPHAAERALWKAQREAGTNEVWQCGSDDQYSTVLDIPVNDEPLWLPKWRYRVKPMKLTARIVRNNHKFDTRVQDWQFFGTREEYRAECEKYGYVVVSEITEVKPETVKYYLAMFISKNTGLYGADVFVNKDDIDSWMQHFNCTIIGDIESREVEIE